MATIELADEELSLQIREARRQSAEAARVEPRALSARYEKESRRVVLELMSGCLFAFPIEAVGDLQDASDKDLAAVEVWQDGEGLHWEGLDADVSVPGIVGRMLNLPEWAPRWMGQAKSTAKARASRTNGRRGGRPTKKTATKPAGASAVREKPGG